MSVDQRFQAFDPSHHPARRRREVTAAMIAANRRNALRSTGPRTSSGKAAVRYNALKHGGRAAVGVLLPGEEGPAFDRHLQTTLAELSPLAGTSPTDDDNKNLVREVAQVTWRLDRLRDAEARRAWDRHGAGNTADPEAGANDLLGVIAAETKLTGRYLRLMRQLLSRRPRARRDKQSRGCGFMSDAATERRTDEGADEQSRGCGAMSDAAMERRSDEGADKQSRGGGAMSDAATERRSVEGADKQSRETGGATTPVGGWSDRPRGNGSESEFRSRPDDQPSARQLASLCSIARAQIVNATDKQSRGDGALSAECGV